MIVSFTKKFIFFKPIKTAGSSVEEILSQACDPTVDIITPDSHRTGVNHIIGDIKLFNHIRLPEFLKTNIINLDQFKNNFHKITICRNPWDKQVSSFWHVAKLENKYDGLTLEQIKARYLVDFQDYIFRICRDGKEGQKMVSREFFFYDNGVPFFNTCLRFEYLQEDFDILCKKLRIKQQVLPRLKSNTRLLPGSYKTYYNTETYKLVKDCYKEAIDFFGYLI
jgi:hypothetical protein